MVNIQGPGGFRMDFPFPRLPRWIGTPNLRANNAVYPRVDLDIPIIPFSADVAAGVLALVKNVDTTLVRNWSSRFGALFKEFAIVGCRFEIRQGNSGNSDGCVLAYIDENSSAAPNSTSLDYPHAEVPISASSVDSAGSLHLVEWVAKSYDDLTWDPTSTTGLVAYLKLYADTTDTGTAVTTTNLMTITGSIAVAFRGYV